ncbi:MAG TPA: hypothetical protein VK775_11115 [Chthoniobacterales bacterium]|nr:hypothetical protein [Chthoniobacterales bacterium]
MHDLGNSVSGINSLSDYHLRSGVSDPGLEESLTLIRESAELSRDLLVGVGDLLQPNDVQEELVQVCTLITEAGKFISLLLPKSIKFEISGAEQNDAVISLVRGDFLRKILALVAMDVNELRIPTGTIELSCTHDEINVRIRYRSTLRSDSALRERAPALLANLSRSMEVEVAVDGADIALTMTFPIAGTAG